MVDLVSLRALFGPGAPDPDLARFQIHYKWKFTDFPLVLYLCDMHGGQEFWPTFASATKNFAPLICRVVRAVLVLGAGLGFPVGAPAVFTPNLRSNPAYPT